MTPRQLRVGIQGTPVKNIDKKEIIKTRIDQIEKVVSGYNAVFEDEEIPFKLKLVLYENEIDFEHLNKTDYNSVQNAPKIVNGQTERWYSKLNY